MITWAYFGRYIFTSTHVAFKTSGLTSNQWGMPFWAANFGRGASKNQVNHNECYSLWWMLFEWQTRWRKGYCNQLLAEQSDAYLFQPEFSAQKSKGQNYPRDKQRPLDIEALSKTQELAGPSNREPERKEFKHQQDYLQSDWFLWESLMYIRFKNIYNSPSAQNS